MIFENDLKVCEIAKVSHYIKKGYTLYYGVTKNNKVTLLIGKGKIFLTYDPEQQDFLMTGVKSK